MCAAKVTPRMHAHGFFNGRLLHSGLVLTCEAGASSLLGSFKVYNFNTVPGNPDFLRRLV